MADSAIGCLRTASVAIAIWSILFSLIDMAIMAWQAQEVKTMQWEYEHRALPSYHSTHTFQQRFPGLFALYVETGERRRINALLVLVIINLILSFVQLAMSFVLLYGAAQKDVNFIWPWFCSSIPLVLLSTAYAVLWWAGDVFNEQLIISILIFLFAFVVQSVCIIIVLVYYMKLRGQFRSARSAKEQIAHGDIPPWRHDWSLEPPPANVLRQIRHKQRQRARSEERLNWPKQTEYGRWPSQTALMEVQYGHGTWRYAPSERLQTPNEERISRIAMSETIEHRRRSTPLASSPPPRLIGYDSRV